MSHFGNLYIVATPIGNLSDITQRAVEVLRESDLILSEDTRETSKILSALDISTPQISYRDQNHTKVVARLIEDLKNGQSLALVSDSGTPLISDPGYKLVQEVIENDIEVIAIPGPSAVISALVISGLPTDKFVFLGFLPKSNGKKVRMIKEFGALDATLTIYESPYRIKGLLRDIHETLGNRSVCVVKELTKKFEKTYRGSLQEVEQMIENDKPRGEYVVLVAKEGFQYGSNN